MDDLVYIFCSSTVVTEGLKEIASMQSKTPGLKGGICDQSVLNQLKALNLIMSVVWRRFC